MEKLVVIINGSGGAGKDTICKVVENHYGTMNVSSVDPIKKIAMENGWDGQKSEKSRKFLADLKRLFVDYNDLPLQYLAGKYKEFLNSTKDIMFAHIREPEEIRKFKDCVGKNCVTLLVRRNGAGRKAWNNSSDDDVEKYEYDFYYENSKGLGELEQDFMAFFEEKMLGRGV